MARNEFKKSLIVSGPNTSKAPCFWELEGLIKEAGMSYGIFTDISGEPTDVMVDSCVKAYSSK